MREFLLPVALAFRSLRRDATLVGAVVAMFALAIGLNTAVFSVLSAVVLRPLEYVDADRLVRIRANWARDPGADLPLAGGFLQRLAQETSVFSDVAAAGPARVTYVRDGMAELIDAGHVSGNLFLTLGSRAVAGRLFRPDEPPHSVVLSYGFWVEQFGGEVRSVGRTLQLDGIPHTVVGVVPPDFALHLPFARPPAVWISPDPVRHEYWMSEAGNQGALWYLARLAPGAGLERGRAEVARVAAAVRERQADFAQYEIDFTLDPLHGWITRPVKPLLMVLLAAVGFVLIGACANAINLLLVRAGGRVHELAVRRVLGATKVRLVLQFLTEGAILAVLGAGGGLVVAALSLRLIRRLAPGGIPRIDDVTIDAGILLFAIGLTVVATLLAALAPAYLAVRNATPVAAMGGNRVAGTRDHRTLRFGLAAAQIALALVLVIGSGLLTVSLIRMQRVDPGFDTTGLLTFSVAPPSAEYRNGEETSRFLESVEQEFLAIPGVQAVGIGWPTPLKGQSWNSPYAIDADPQDVSRRAAYRIVTPRFFEALGVRLLDGRYLIDSDVAETVVVSRTVAELAWPGESALGHHILMNPWGLEDRPFEVVGVVEDIVDFSMRESPGPALYAPMRGWAWAGQDYDILVRGAGHPTTVIPELRTALARIAPGVALADAMPYEGLIDRQFTETRFVVLLVGTFGVAAACIAVLGIYGVMSWQVSRRRQQIAVHLAIGAPAVRVLWLVLASGVRVIIVGVAAGLAAAWWLARLLSAQLYAVTATDLPTWAGATALLAGAALCATWIPARRASALEPMVMLREE